MMTMIIMRNTERRRRFVYTELIGSSLNDDNDNHEKYRKKKKVCQYLN